MPKITHIDVTISGEYKRYEIHYNQDKFFHLKGFPKEIMNMTEFNAAYYATQGQLEEETRKALRLYHEKIKETSKVILYEIALPTQMRMNRTGRGSYMGRSELIPASLENNIKEFPFYSSACGDNSFGFIVNYEVAMCITEASGLSYYTIKDDGSIGNRKAVGSKQLSMVWSEEREAFFANMNEGCRAMVAKMLAFFGQDKELLLQMIEAGGQKLLQ